MAFSLDYSKTDNIIPEGKYECIIENIYENITPGGTVYIDIPLIVRNDIEQKYKNAHIWHAIWKKKEPNQADEACGGYSSYQINALSKAAGLPAGKQYAGLAEWMEDLKGKLLIATIKHEEYKGKQQAKVYSIANTLHPDCKHVFKKNLDAPPPKAAAPAVNNNDDFSELEVGDDDDLPF